MAKSAIETMITWTSGAERAEVYSLMPRIWRQCIAAGGDEIRWIKGIRDGQPVARLYSVPVKAVRIRKQRVLTKKQQEGLRNRGRALAAAKMGLGS